MVIEVKDLSKVYKSKIKHGFFKDMFNPEYKKTKAVDSISFKINKGESVAFLGPNGAGKTTTMKMMTGLLYPSQGNVDVLGFFPFDRKPEFLKRIGLVMGNRSGLAWDLTPNQNFELIRKVYQIPEKACQERIEMLTEMLGVSEYMNIQVRKLSLGERMKMELINSILHNPEVLFLDEPTIGLDIVSKQKIRVFLRDIQQRLGITILLTSHDMDDIEKVSDRVIIINNGKIIFDNAIQKLLQKYRSKKYLTLTLEEEIEKSKLEKYGKIVESKPYLYTLEIDASKQSEILANITKNLPVEDIDIIRVPLDEIIADMFTSSSAKPKK